MSEKLPGKREEVRLTISHDEAIADPARREAYRLERSLAKANGQRVWEIRSFQPFERGQNALATYDYFFKEIPRGYLEGNDEIGYDVRAAMFKVESTAFGPHIEQVGMINLSLDGPKDNFYEAKKTLEDFVHGTVLPEGMVE